MGSCCHDNDQRLAPSPPRAWLSHLSSFHPHSGLKKEVRWPSSSDEEMETEKSSHVPDITQLLSTTPVPVHARLGASIYRCGSHRLLQGLAPHHLQVLPSKRENERSLDPTVFSAPSPDNLSHQPATCPVLSHVSVGMPSIFPGVRSAPGGQGSLSLPRCLQPAEDLTCSRHSANPRCVREQRNAGRQPSSSGALLTNPPVTLVRSSHGPLCPPHADQTRGAPRLCEFWWMTVVGCFPG